MGCTSLLMLGLSVKAQSSSTEKNNMNMKMNAGIITPKLAETKAFYQRVLTCIKFRD